MSAKQKASGRRHAQAARRVETRMRELFDARLNLDDKPMTPAELAEAVKTADVLVPTVTDASTPPCSPRPDRKLKLIANFGNGVDNIDVAAAHAARHHRHQHAGRADRGHRRHDHGADPRGAAPARRRRARADRTATTGPAGRRPGCSATASAASGSASSAWAASARRWRAAPRAFGLQIHYHNRRRVAPQIEEELERDLLGKPRPDAGAHGHRLGQLPAHAGDLSPAVGAAAEADAAGRLHRQHRARRGDRRERAGAADRGRRDRAAPASTCSSTSRRSIRSCVKLAKAGKVVLLPHMGSATHRRPRRHGREGHHQHQDLHGRPQAAGPRAAEHALSFNDCVISPSRPHPEEPRSGVSKDGRGREPGLHGSTRVRRSSP